jgi:hypothetical protein
MRTDMTYDGQILVWNRHGSFKATSGLPDYQYPPNECLPDKGPIPEGTYQVRLKEDTHGARDDGTDTCTLSPSNNLQAIPRGKDAGTCEPFWVNWGWNRIGLHPADVITARKCRPRRGGFYLHDSTKGYTHGCIEVEGIFFSAMRSFMRAMRFHHIPRTSVLTLTVRYVPGRQTNGGTRQP